MSLPASKELASLVFSEKVNQLAHDEIAARGRKLTNGLLVLSAVLGYLAGVSGLADLVGKVWVGAIALAAGISTTCLILAFTMLKSSDHLRTAGEYVQLYRLTVEIDDETTPEGELRFQELWEAFFQVEDKTRAAGTALTPGQVAKYEKEAKEAMRMDLGRGRDPNAEQAELLAPK